MKTQPHRVLYTIRYYQSSLFTMCVKIIIGRVTGAAVRCYNCRCFSLPSFVSLCFLGAGIHDIDTVRIPLVLDVTTSSVIVVIIWNAWGFYGFLLFRIILFVCSTHVYLELQNIVFEYSTVYIAPQQRRDFLFIYFLIFRFWQVVSCPKTSSLIVSG